MKTVLGIFDDYKDADRAIDKLKHNGYNPKDFSIIMKDREEAQKLREKSGSEIADSTMSGVATGAAVGGLTGLLVGIGAIAIPGLGAFLVGGPLAAALGLTGAAATTATGAATGAIAGGLVGALMGLGLSRNDAEKYEKRIQEGGILLAVPAADDRADEVEQLLEQHNSSDIKILDADDVPDTRQKTYLQSRHTGLDESEHKHASPSQIEHYLKAVDYPTTKDDLIETAEEEGAENDVLDTLNELPEVKFESPNEVKRAIRHLP